MRARVRVAPHRDARHESDAGRDLACSAAPRRCRCSCLRLRSSLSGRRSKRTAPPAAAASRCGSAAACSSSASGSLTRMTSKRSSGGSCCTCMDLDVVRWGLVHPPELQTKANKGLASALSQLPPHRNAPAASCERQQGAHAALHGAANHTCLLPLPLLPAPLLSSVRWAGRTVRPIPPVASPLRRSPRRHRRGLSTPQRRRSAPADALPARPRMQEKAARWLEPELGSASTARVGGSVSCP
jgi:hypothetical protein